MLTNRKPSFKHDPATAHYLNGMERLVKAVRDLSMARDMPAIQNIIRSAAREMTGADGATFVLRDGNFCHYVDENAISPLWKGKRFPMEACISGWAMLNRRTAVIEDIYKDSRIPADAYRPTFVKSLAMVPIRTAVPVGAIGNYWARPYRPTAEEVTLLETLADTTAIAIENVQAYLKLEERVRQRTAELQTALQKIDRLSLCDVVTGLYNRRGFILLADQELQRKRQHVEALIIEMDGLKEINERLGPETCDSLIADAVRVIQAALEENDLFGRIAGNELCILALDHPSKGLRTRVQNAIDTFNIGSHPFHLSLHISTPASNVKDVTLESLLPHTSSSAPKEKRCKKKTAA
jgi:diguanylate cyclase (GGDEF)-like protein